MCHGVQQTPRPFAQRRRPGAQPQVRACEVGSVAPGPLTLSQFRLWEQGEVDLGDLSPQTTGEKRASAL